MTRKFSLSICTIFLLTQNVIVAESKQVAVEKLMQEKMQKIALQYQACVQQLKLAAQDELTDCDKESIEYLYFVQKNKELHDVRQERGQAREESDAWQAAFKKSEFKRCLNYIFGFEVW